VEQEKQRALDACMLDADAQAALAKFAEV
jgi:hypothetical protein